MSSGEKSHEVKSKHRKDREIGGALWSGLVREGGRRGGGGIEQPARY